MEDSRFRQAYRRIRNAVKAKVRNEDYVRQHGTGPDIPLHSPAIPRQRSELPYPGPAAQPLHHYYYFSLETKSWTYQFPYDLPKMKAHGIIERDGKRYAYRFLEKGVTVALTFVFFDKQFCGPFANSFFHPQLNADSSPKSKLQTACSRRVFSHNVKHTPGNPDHA